MRIFLNTDVLVAAATSRGLCRDLLRSVLEDHDALVSKRVVDELVKVLRDKIGVPESELEKALMILGSVEVVDDQERVPQTADLEPADAVIFASAIDAKADIFITGDQGILAESHRLPIAALSPRTFMELARSPADRYPIRSEEEGGPRVSDSTEGTVRERAFDFALSVIALCQALDDNRRYVISKQLLRAGTSIGANIEEASAAESRRDFLHKMNIASKEARETNYWLRLLDQSKAAPQIDVKPYLGTSLELIRLLTAIAKTTAKTTRQVKADRKLRTKN